MLMKGTKYWMFFFFIAVMCGCNKEKTIDPKKQSFGLEVPSYFPSLKYRIELNPISKDKFELGKKLFYDVRLSANSTISCAGCHRQADAFANAGKVVSIGIHNNIGTRNSPAIMNLAWNPVFMWDGGIADLDLQAIAPLTNDLEMGTEVQSILKKLNSDNEYRSLFKKAFNEDKISSVSFLKSLSQFMLMCVSKQSKYDSVMRKEAAFSNEEKAGYAVFLQHCNNCHKEPLFTSNMFKNNGTPSADLGRNLVTLLDEDKYTFKIPSLRNLKYTAPYMHNGSLGSLDEVIRFYTYAKVFPYADAVVKNGIPLTQEQQSHLIAFLNTLNDEEFVTNPLLSEK